MVTIVEGKIAVKAVLNSKFRTVKEIYIEENIERISSMMVELNFELIKENSK